MHVNILNSISQDSKRCTENTEQGAKSALKHRKPVVFAKAENRSQGNVSFSPPSALHSTLAEQPSEVRELSREEIF